MSERMMTDALPRRLAFAWSAGLLLAVFLACVLLVSLAVGPVPLKLAEVVRALLGLDADARAEAIVWHLRLPRSLMAGLIGAALGIAGALMQGLFRNPMADPGLVGVTGGAGLSAASAIVFAGWLYPAAWQPVMLPGLAFAGGLAVTLMVYRFSQVEGRTAITMLLLAGIALNAIASSGIGMMSFLSDDRQLRDITFWLLGSVAGATWGKLMLLAPFALLPILLAPWLARALDAFNLGEREAAHLGFPIERVKSSVCFAVALAAGGAVAFSGIIAFIGLVVPHLVRLWLGPGHRRLLPCSALAGASLLILADTVARTIAAPAELPVGLLTALIGAPFFLALLLRQRKELAV